MKKGKTQRDAERLQKIIEIDKDLNRIQDLDLILERILFNARRVVNADAGTVYIREGDTLVFHHAQNETLEARLKPGQKLIYSSFTVPIDDNSISGYVASRKRILNIPDMYTISSKEPYSFNPSYDKRSGYKSVSSLTFPLISSDNTLLGVLQLLNARDGKGRFVSFSPEDEPFIEHFASNATVALHRAQIFREMLLRMAAVAELRDPQETGPHVNRVGVYSMEIYDAWAHRRNLSEEKREKYREILRMAAMLHDVGKVGLSDALLKKPGQLTDEERWIMQSHTWVGARLFSRKGSDLDRVAGQVALHHHENWDGGGYPGRVNIMESDEQLRNREKRVPGLRGEQIPLFARIVSLADVYDALSSKRIYKEAWDESKVLSEIRAFSGRKFDPELVNIVFSIQDNLGQLRKLYPEAS